MASPVYGCPGRRWLGLAGMHWHRGHRSKLSNQREHLLASHIQPNSSLHGNWSITCCRGIAFTKTQCVMNPIRAGPWSPGSAAHQCQQARPARNTPHWKTIPTAKTRSLGPIFDNPTENEPRMSSADHVHSSPGSLPHITPPVHSRHIAEDGRLSQTPLVFTHRLTSFLSRPIGKLWIYP
ncbi:hypothetical protein VUR80DRAFT_463 [Thermomyces stellatus]